MVEEQEVDPVIEAKRIVNRYLSELGWSNEFKEQIVRELIPAADREIKLRNADAMELVADEHFGVEIDRLRNERTKTSLAILAEVAEQLGKRKNISFFGKRIIKRIKEELE